MRERNNLFYIVYSIWVFSHILLIQSNFNGGAYYNVIKYCAYGMCILIFVLDNYVCTMAELVRILFLGVVCVLLFRHSNSMFLIDLLFMLLACKRVDFDRIIRLDFKIRLAAMAAVIALNQLGIIESANNVKNLTTRYSLGFNHVNALSLTAFILLCEFLYINYEAMTMKKYILACVWVLVFFKIAVSSTFLLMSGAGILLSVPLSAVWSQKTMEQKRRQALILIALVIASWAVSIFFMIFFDSSVGWMNRLDDLFMGRFRLLHSGVRNFGIPLFGQEVKWITTTMVTSEDVLNVVDNGLGRMFITQGLIPTLILLAGMIFTLRTAYQKEKYQICFLFVLIMAYGIAESGCYYIMTSPVLLAVGQALYSRRWEEEMDEEELEEAEKGQIA